jgi:thiamine monophosphate synthase
MVRKVTEEEILEYIRATCQAQGIPVLVEDEHTLAAIATIFKSA